LLYKFLNLKSLFDWLIQIIYLINWREQIIIFNLLIKKCNEITFIKVIKFKELHWYIKFNKSNDLNLWKYRLIIRCLRISKVFILTNWKWIIKKQSFLINFLKHVSNIKNQNNIMSRMLKYI
jgi:hypothetical protein